MKGLPWLRPSRLGLLALEVKIVIKIRFFSTKIISRKIKILSQITVMKIRLFCSEMITRKIIILSNNSNENTVVLYWNDNQKDNNTDDDVNDEDFNNKQSWNKEEWKQKINKDNTNIINTKNKIWTNNNNIDNRTPLPRPLEDGHSRDLHLRRDLEKSDNEGVMDRKKQLGEFFRGILYGQGDIQYHTHAYTNEYTSTPTPIFFIWILNSNSV